MASHHQSACNDAEPLDLRDALTISVAKEEPSAVRFDPNGMAYEAFSMSGFRTRLLEPLKAAKLSDALAETTSRWVWGRGDRLAVREIGARIDRLHVYAVRRSSHGVRREWGANLEYAHSLELIATIDLNVVAGIPVGLVGSERALHAHDQARRPEGARLSR